MNYKIIQKISDLPNFPGAKRLVFDCETSGLSAFHGDRMCGFAIGPYDYDVSYYIPIRHFPNQAIIIDDNFINLPPENIFSWLKQFTNNPELSWVGHNLKFDLTMLRADGIEISGSLLDTMILAHIINGDEPSYSLDSLTKKYLIYFVHRYYKELENYLHETQPIINTCEGKVFSNYSRTPIKILGFYACEDLSATRELCKYLVKQPAYSAIKTNGSISWGTQDLIKNEMELIKVLMDMEYQGVRVNLDRCCELRDIAEEEIEMLNHKLFNLAGHKFSPSAWTELWAAFEKAGGQILYWSAKEKGKQKADQFTTDKAISTGRPCWNSVAILNYLKKFKEDKNERAYEFILTYWQSEQRRRIIASNLDPYLKHTDFNGRLHGQFHQHGTVTGRLSSSNPNLQNVAKVKGTAEQKSIEKFLGIQDQEALNRQIRGLFIPDSGNILVSQDYSGIEYRTAAYFSQDKILMQKYRDNPLLDYHEDTAQLAQIDRDSAKTVNFGTLYGMGSFSLGLLLGVPQEKAQAILNRVFDAKPALRLLISQVSSRAKKSGFVQNPFGRVCLVQPEKAYKALNLLVQGHCGDAMRCALVRIHKFIQEEKLPVKLLLTVHDEIVYECPRVLGPEIAKKIAPVFCDWPHMQAIPVVCDTELGLDWGKGLKKLEVR